MRLIIQNHFFAVFILFSLFFFASSLHADAFKCVDKTGNIIFQDSACTDDEKETLIEIQKSTHSTHSNQCNSQCDTKRTICIVELGNGARNTNRNLLLCEKAKEACYVNCQNSYYDGKLETLTAVERSSYERKLRRKQLLKNEAIYKKEQERRVANWEQKRKQRHCHRYEKKLEKIKEKWKRKQRKGWKPKDEEYYIRKIENAEDELTIECK